MNRLFLITLAGTLDDMPVAIFTDREKVLTFIAENPPRPVDGAGCKTAGPLANASKVAGRGPSYVFGYEVTVFYGDGTRFAPQESHQLQWSEEQWPTDGRWQAMTNQERLTFLASVINEPF